MSAMGFVPTAQMKTIAGHSCKVHNSQSAGTACLTEDLLILEQSVMGHGMIAVSVVYEPGDDENYRKHENATITEGPHLSNGLSGIDLGNGVNLGDLMGQQ